MSYKLHGALKPTTNDRRRINCESTIAALGITEPGVIEVMGKRVEYTQVGKALKRGWWLWRCPKCGKRVAHVYEPDALCRYCLKLESPSRRTEWRRLPIEARRLIRQANRKPTPPKKIE